MKVKIDNLTKIYPSRNKKQPEDVIAVNGFDFVIEDGMLVGLLGPSGCGKSTTLNLLSLQYHIHPKSRQYPRIYLPEQFDLFHAHYSELPNLLIL
ncbi:MAG: ATP-binding cassette domain-containing protein, partial [Clostridia bacterium]|nr:ATP-binding cassette domain-containing protein [Clostridia bacterium]